MAKLVDHYGHHKLLFALAILVHIATMVLLQFQLPITGTAVTGLLLLLSGRKALLAGDSLLTGLGGLQFLSGRRTTLFAAWSLIVTGVGFIIFEFQVLLAPGP